MYLAARVWRQADPRPVVAGVGSRAASAARASSFVTSSAGRSVRLPASAVTDSGLRARASSCSRVTETGRGPSRGLPSIVGPVRGRGSGETRGAGRNVRARTKGLGRVRLDPLYGANAVPADGASADPVDRPGPGPGGQDVPNVAFALAHLGGRLAAAEQGGGALGADDPERRLRAVQRGGAPPLALRRMISANEFAAAGPEVRAPASSLARCSANVTGLGLGLGGSGSPASRLDHWTPATPAATAQPTRQSSRWLSGRSGRRAHLSNV